MVLECAQRAGDPHQQLGPCALDPGLADQDRDLQAWLGEAERDRDEALARARLHPFEQVLITGIVGDDQHESGRRLQGLAGALQRQDASIVRQRVQHHRGVLARLHHLVEITDGALAYSTRERTIAPEGALGADQMAAHQVSRG